MSALTEVPVYEHALLMRSQRLSGHRVEAGCLQETDYSRHLPRSHVLLGWHGRWLLPPSVFHFGFFFFWCVCPPPHTHWVSAGSMNTLPGRATLSLCRRTSAAGGLRLLAGSPWRPDGGPAASVQPSRVCHSGSNPKGSVTTKKRGYDITRNPHLNKVSSLLSAVELGSQHSGFTWKQYTQLKCPVLVHCLHSLQL